MKRILAFLFLGAVTVHGALTVTDRGTGNSNSSTATLVCTPSGTIAAGSTAVLAYAGDNANGSSSNVPDTITDSVSNKWYRFHNVIGTSGTNASIEAAYYVSVLTTQLTTSNNVTITFSAANVTAKCYTFTEIAPASGKLALPANRTASNVTTTTAPTITTFTISNNDCVVGMGASQSEDRWTGDADTSNGSWSAQQHDAAGTGSTGMSITSQSKIVTASATQTYNPTLSSSAQCALIVQYFIETDLKARTAGSSTVAGASTDIYFFRPLAAGSLGVIWIGVDNAGTNGASQNLPSSGTDSQGNTWTLQQTGIFDNGTASQGVEIGLYTSPLTTALTPPNDFLTLTYSIANVAAKAYGAWEFTGSTYVTGGVGSGATTGTPSVTTGSITSGHTVIGLCGAESADTFTGDSDSTNGTWSSQNSISGGSSTTGMSATSQYKTVTATATQTYNPTLTSADTMIGWIEIRPTVVPAQSSFLMFFP